MEQLVTTMSNEQLLKLVELRGFSALTVALYNPAALGLNVYTLNSIDDEVNVKTEEGVATKVGYEIYYVKVARQLAGVDVKLGKVGVKAVSPTMYQRLL